MACLCLWAVDVLNWDEWLIWATALEKLRAGGLTFSDIILQNNEQRSAIVRLVGLGFFPLFRLARWPELATIMIMAGGCVLLAGRLFRLTISDATGQASVPDRRLLLVFSLLGFSLLQWETFSVGINTSVILPVLGLWTGVCLVWGCRRLGLARLCGLFLVGLLPSFSFANALFYWLCLAPLVALRAGPGRRIALTGLWLALGALVWAGYFHGYVKPGHHPSILLALLSPHILAGYFTTYLGGALVGDRNLLPLAFFSGAIGLIALATLTRAAWRAGTEARATLWPWLCVVCFTLLTAAATAVARGGFGLGQAQESRYATFSTPLWMALAALAFLHWQKLTSMERRWLGRGFALCAVFFALSTVLAAVVLYHRAPRLELARKELYSLTQPANLLEVFPDPAFVLANMPLFLKMRAGIYRDLRPLSDYRTGTRAEGAFRVIPWIEVSGRVPGFLLLGQSPGQADRKVLVRTGESDGGRIVGLGVTDATGRLELFLPENALPKGPQRLFAAVLDRDGRTLHPLRSQDLEDGAAVENAGRKVMRFDLDRHFYIPGAPQAP
ncbi:MAG: hypothetical protein KKF77_10635 [Proteobacteria bacterium]|nr:hypothetical protein [Pseudomonadota bacterium]